MRKQNLWMWLVVALSAPLAFVACERREVDRTNRIERSYERTDDSFERAGDRIERAGERAGDRMEEAADEVEDELD